MYIGLKQFCSLNSFQYIGINSKHVRVYMFIEHMFSKKFIRHFYV
jgi:hypothetical protein